jgi:OmpA-OmpF porin, OOP family
MKICTIQNFLATLFLSVFIMPAFAQTAAENKKSADFYYRAGNYFSAALYYQAYLNNVKATTTGFIPYTSVKKGKASEQESNDVIINRMAESYRLYHDHAEAEKAYDQLKDNKAFPDARYWLALSLRANGKYQQAKEQLQQYIQQPGTKYADEARLELQGLAFMEEQLKKSELQSFTIVTAPGIFTSERAELNGKTSPNQTVTVYATNEKGVMEKIELPSVEGSLPGTASLTEDGRRIYFTNMVNDHSLNKAAIYHADKNDNAWSVPVKMKSINLDGYNSQQPFVSADGRYLLFSSDRPAGVGKLDIWYAVLNEKGEAGEAINAGRMINTANDDQAPFYHANSHSLVVASNGRVGMGGFDLYEAKGDLPGNWGNVTNLGYPVNSNRDDIYFSSASNGKLLEHAIIGSDRKGDYCLASYTIEKLYPKFIAGRVTDCNAGSGIGSASVSYKDLPAAITQGNGEFFIQVKSFEPGTIQTSRQGYAESSTSFTSPQNSNADTIEISICLQPVTPPVEKPAGDNKVYFEFASYELSAETKQFLDTLAALLTREPKLKLVAIGYTDKVGSEAFNQNLSEQRASAVKQYLESKGIESQRIDATGKGACCSLMPETIDGKDDPAARQINRRVEFDLKLIMQ